MLKIIEKSKIWFGISLTIILLGIGFMIYRGGLNFGIDFVGGTKIVIQMPEGFSKSDADDIIKKHATDAVTNTVNESQLEVKGKDLDSTKVSELMGDLKGKFELKDDALVSQDEIGASIGKELTRTSILSLSIAVIAMLIYVAIRFEFRFGIAAILALLHDVLLTLAVYSIFNVPVNTPFIAAILSIVGYSINDTIVIFDRIRENVKKMRRVDPKEVANTSIKQTLSRSILTSLTTLVTIAAVFAFVPTVREFAFPLIVGIISGTYSSIFIASPIWVMLKNKK